MEVRIKPTPTGSESGFIAEISLTEEMPPSEPGLRRIIELLELQDYHPELHFLLPAFDLVS
jgi:hypothetical protein